MYFTSWSHKMCDIAKKVKNPRVRFICCREKNYDIVLSK